jgi:uncharacterized cupredoxin-like copper-binding protein
MSITSCSRTLLAISLLCVPALPAFAAESAVVSAELWNKPDGSQGVTLSSDHVKAGKVTFKVKNVSTNEDHELLLVKTDLAPSAIPMDANRVWVDEEKLQGLKVLGEVHPGKSRDTTLTLKPGKYLLFCNETGHFRAGMYTYFTVTQ